MATKELVNNASKKNIISNRPENNKVSGPNIEAENPLSINEEKNVKDINKETLTSTISVDTKVKDNNCIQEENETNKIL